ncbi:hypothetical protein JW977_03960 [Candidatus Falkowbacteria bacterium]|nr:hypothetical protein [Candidatus Falkowbacteria bacterium]
MTEEVLIHTELVQNCGEKKPAGVAKTELRKIPDWLLACTRQKFISFNGVPAVIRPANEGCVVIDPHYDDGKKSRVN